MPSGNQGHMVQDLHETAVVDRPKNQKFAAVQDLTMLALSADGKDFESPSASILDRGVQISIKDLKKTMK